MNIADVRIRLVENDSNLKAFASFTIDNAFVVRNVRIIEGSNGFFLSMPSRRTPNGDYTDIVHPINTETREQITEALVKAYQEEKAKTKTEE